MTPLQIKQQKFSKLSAIMQPELQKIQKVQGKNNDTAAMQKMQGGNTGCISEIRRISGDVYSFWSSSYFDGLISGNL